MSVTGRSSHEHEVFSRGFLWGVATAGHQNEGDNVDSDTWFLENVTPTVFQEPSGQGLQRLGAVGDRPRPRRRHGPQRLPLLGRVGARRARSRASSPTRRSTTTRRSSTAASPVGLAPVVTFNHFTVAALVRDARRWLDPRGARPVRPLLRRGDGSLRRPHRVRRHVQRARTCPAAHLGRPARLRPRPRARDARGGAARRPASSATGWQRHAARGVGRHRGRA